MDFFHDFILGLLIFILITVITILWNLFISKNLIKYFFDSFRLEFVWTLYPIFILILIGIPRIRILYLHEVEDENNLTLKFSGHQWYWNVDYRDFKDLEFDIFIKPVNELNFNEFRLLETDNHSVIPLNMNIRIVISRADVLHSWTIPNLGIKVDANPGRINLIHFLPFQRGLYFGQCREICGANHSFIPINLEIVSFLNFKEWVLNYFN